MNELPSPESTRRADIVARPVRLSDGREWSILAPTRLLRPEVVVGADALGRPVETVRVTSRFGYTLAIRRLISRVQAASQSDDIDEQCAAFFALAAALLHGAHEVDDVFACELLTVTEEELPGLARAVMAIVRQADLGTGARAATDAELERSCPR